jgi:hypothetical protein
MTNKEIQSQINEISKDIYNGTQLAFSQLEVIRLICLNIKISVGKIGDNPEVRALSTIGDIITESIDKIEEYTKGGRDASKQIAQLLEQLNLEE